MTEPQTLTWHDTNQGHLVAALARVRASLAAYGVQPSEQGAGERRAPAGELDDHRRVVLSEPPALATLCATFALSPFERDVLLLCAGMELDGSFPALCAAAHGDPSRAYPTFGLALAVLPEAHWSALTPDAPLRRWRLIEISPGHTLVSSPLRIDERILHYLCGLQHLDERLMGMIEPLRSDDDLPPSLHALAAQIAAILASAGPESPLVVQLYGKDRSVKHTIVSAACTLLGLRLWRVDAATLPTAPSEREALARLWERESRLSAGALLLDCEDLAEAPHEATAARLLERLRCPLILASRERRPVYGQPAISFEVPRPLPQEQQALWSNALGSVAPALNGQIGALSNQFSLDAPAIQAAARQALALGCDDHALPARLWNACRAQVRPHLGEFAQCINSVASWDDLILPDAQLHLLREMVIHVRQRTQVYQHWGWAARGDRGLGINALFTGASGTGKTMAAEVLAGALRLDLYRIDLSQVVSKYIGETEKNLRRVFDAADEGGAILLFDEADALFGKRSEVKDSHDRYANIEVGYLLQRMEAYRGLAILTTNMKDALDAAFVRRIRFIVQFPFPDAAQRARIWQHVFPQETPTEGLCADRLARLNVAGGSIRTIALHASFLAAEAGDAVRMTHLLAAARSEYAKLEKPLTEAEIRGWI